MSKSNYKKILKDKVFPLPPSKTYNNLMIDNETLTYITTPYNSLIITSIINDHIPEHISRSEITILDGTACIGGDSISFGKIFGKVIATEIDEHRCKMLVNNLSVYNLNNVIPINDDYLKIYKTIDSLNIIYFDPPWGGSSYKNYSKLRLTIGTLYIDEIVINILNENLNNIKLIVLKLPKNYDLQSLYEKIKNKDITMYLYELKKMNVIVIEKNNSWNNFKSK